MDKRDIIILELHEALEHNNEQSQREMSKKLNISLGLVNALLKEFITKEYYRSEQINKNKFKYIITSKGVSEKTALTYKYLQHLIKHYNEIKERIDKVFEELVRKQVESIVIFGINEFTEISYILAKKLGIEIVAVIEDAKTTDKFLDLHVHDISYIKQCTYCAIIITNIDNVFEKKGNLKKLGVSDCKIFQLFRKYS